MSTLLDKMIADVEKIITNADAKEVLDDAGYTDFSVTKGCHIRHLQLTNVLKPLSLKLKTRGYLTDEEFAQFRRASIKLFVFDQCYMTVRHDQRLTEQAEREGD